MARNADDDGGGGGAPATQSGMTRLLCHLTSGLVAGTAATVVLYPMDLLKTRYQVHVKGSPYASIVSGLRAVFVQEGVRGMYQGLMPAVFGSSLSWGGYFFFYEAAKDRRLRTAGLLPPTGAGSSAGAGVHKPSLGALDHLVCGAEAGTIMVLLTNPLWLIKTRMQLQVRDRTGGSAGNARRYKGIVDAVSTIVREEGPLALYRGTVPALLLVSHGSVQFMVYEYLKKHIPFAWSGANATQHHSGIVLGIGAVAKVIASTTTYPFQVIKARLQQRGEQVAEAVAAGKPKSVHPYSGVVDCASKIWRFEGIKGFFKGCIPNALRVAPGAALTFVVYEKCIRWLLSQAAVPSTAREAR